MTRQVVRLATSTALLGVACLTLTGCGGSTPTANSSTSAKQTAAASTPTVPATDVVSQFLDEVRRGGENSQAQQLLTQLAQSELKRIGRTVEPIGSPDASFTVTRGEAVPDDPNAMLVHSVWSEPNAEGGKSEYQVVWALQKESVGWRISGLAMEIDPAQEPIVLNFEDGNLVQQMLSDEPAPAPASGTASQAAVPATVETR